MSEYQEIEYIRMQLGYSTHEVLYKKLPSFFEGQHRSSSMSVLLLPAHDSYRPEKLALNVGRVPNTIALYRLSTSEKAITVRVVMRWDSIEKKFRKNEKSCSARSERILRKLISYCTCTVSISF